MTNAVESAALFASLGCIAHCLALPLVILLLPGALALFAQSEAFHAVLLGLVLPTALTAFWLGSRRHGAIWPGLLGTLGIAGLGVALFLAGTAQVALTVTGSLLLIGGHLINWRLRSRAARVLAR